VKQGRRGGEAREVTKRAPVEEECPERNWDCLEETGLPKENRGRSLARAQAKERPRGVKKMAPVKEKRRG
jgi:hypothetical protein